MAQDKNIQKTTVNLRKSIATDYVPEVVNRLSLANDQIIFAPPGANPALPIQNTGIERNGGVTNYYITNQFYGSPNFGDSRGSNFPTQNGQLIFMHYADSLSPSNVYLTSGGTKTLLGQVSPWGVNLRGPINASDDQEITNNNTILTCKISGTSVTLNELTLADTVLNTRTTSFSILSSLPLPPYTSVNIVHRPKTTQSFSTQQEYILRLGKQAIFLKESTPTTASLRYSNLTNYYIVQSVLYKAAGDSYMVFGTIDGKILSVDRFGDYRYPDGSGLGLGPYNNGTVTGNRNIRAMTTFNKWLIVVGDTARIGSFDGSGWKNFDASGFGTGIYDNSTVLGQNANGNRYVNACAVYGDTGSWIVFSGDSCTTGAYSLNNGWYSASTSGLGPWLGDNSQFKKIAVSRGTALVTANINTRTVTYYKTVAGHRYLMFGADSGISFSYSDTWIGHPVWVGITAVNHGSTAPSCNVGQDLVLPRTIRSATTWQNYYVIGGDSGLIASYGDSGGWRKYGGTGGTGPNSNQAAVGTYNVSYLNTSPSNTPNYLIAQGAGRMGTYIGPAGASWSGYNGTYVEGLYNSGDAAHQLLGSQTITASCMYTSGGDTYFVVGGSGGGIASFDFKNGWWKHFDGSSNGPSNGPYNSGAAVNSQSIVKLLVLGPKLVVVTSNYVANYTGVAWTNYLGDSISGSTGLQPYNNNTALLGYSISDACVWNSMLVVAGATILGGSYYYFYNWLASWDGTNWKNADASGSGTGPYFTNKPVSVFTGGYQAPNNGLSPYTAIRVCSYSTFLIVFGAGSWYTTGNFYYSGTGVGSYDGSNWRYNDGNGNTTGSGTGPAWNNNNLGGTASPGTGVFPNMKANNTGLVNIGIATSWNSKIVVTATWNGNSYVGSWDGSNQKNSDGTGTGTGPYYTGTSIFGSGSPITSITDYLPAATHYMIVGMSAVTGIGSWDGSNWQYYNGGGSGTGPYNNGSVINNAITGALASVNGILAVAGSYYVGNWNASVWQPYNSVGSGSSGYPHAYALHQTTFGRATQLKVWGNKWIFSGSLNAIFCYDTVNGWEQVYNAKNVPPTFFGDTIANPVITQYKNFFVYCMANKVHSYDGTAWRFADSSGVGTGPYSNKCISPNPAKNINIAIAYNNWLVVGGDSGMVASFDGSKWRNVDGRGGACTTGSPDSTYVGLGIGPFALGGTFINYSKIYCSAIYGNNLAFGAAGGNLASFIGSTATNYNGTGLALSAGLNSANIYTLANYTYGGTNYLVAAGGTIGGTGSYLASWNGSTWLAYNGTGTGSYALALNAFGNYPIRSITQHGNYLVCGDSHGNVYSFDPYPTNAGGTIGATSNLSTWVNAIGYCVNAGAVSYAPYADSVTVVNKDVATQLISCGGSLYVLGNTGKLASWDGIGNGLVYAGTWNNYLGVSYTAPTTAGRLTAAATLGTGTYNNGFVQTGISVAPSFFLFNSNYLMSGTVSPFTLLNDQILFPHASSGQIVDLPQTMLAQVFAYKFENGVYLYGITNCNESVWYTLNNSEIDVVNARYAVMEISANRSRAKISGVPFFSGNLNAFGIYGYTDFANFSNYVSYPTLAIASPVVYQSNIGLESVDVVLKKGGDTNNYYSFYAPLYNQVQSALVNVVQSNNVSTTTTTSCGQHPMINAYGKLTNGYGLPAKIEYRAVWLNGVQTALSVAVVDGAVNDCAGTLLTNNGEFDETYIPNVSADNTVITYRNNGQPVVLNITNHVISPPNAIQQIGGNIYKLNTISPLNIVDVQARQLYVGSSDYNGRIIYYSTKPTYPTISNSSISYLLGAFALNGRYSNGLDGGAKFNYINAFNSGNIYQIPGIRLPYVSTTYANYEIDQYLAATSYGQPIYLESVLADGTVVVDSEKQNYQYIQNTIVPLALGYTYGAFTAASFAETVFLAHDVLLIDTPYNTAQYYDGYLNGNTVNQAFTEFFLRGNIYLFDGTNIYQPTFNANGTYASKQFITYANGLQYVGAGPTLSYFFSIFDNAVYSFDGGQQLQKLVRFSRPDIGNIINGRYSALYNELDIQTPTQLIWIRDTVISMTTKPAAMQGMTMTYFDTSSGMVMATPTQQWQFSYFPLTNSTVYPVTYQTAFLGIGDNIKLDIDKWWVTIYDPTTSATQVTLTHNSFDENGDYQEVKVYNLKPSMFTKNGRLVIPMKPRDTRVLATSLTVSSNSKIYLIDLTLFSSEDVEAARVDISNLYV